MPSPASFIPAPATLGGMRFAFIALAIIVGLAAASFAAPAQAQIEPSAQTGSRFKEKPNAMDVKGTRRLQKEFAECVYKQEPGEADAFLRASDYLAIDYEKVGEGSVVIGSKRMMEKCLGEAAPAYARAISISVPDLALRGLLTEEAYLARYDDGPIVLGETAPEFLTTRFVVAGETSDTVTSIGGIADCIVFNDMANSDALLRTKPASKKESAVVQALVPSIGDCMAAGVELRLTAQSIRAIVSDGLWARANAAENVQPAQNIEASQ